MNNIGDILEDGKVKALRALAMFAGLLVYMAGLLYTGAHNFSLMLAGVPEELQVWAVLGVVALEITAAGLPIALHYWLHAPLQKFVGIAFYVIDLALLFGNVVIDFSITAGGTLPAWGEMYLQFVVPGVPLVAMVGWSLLWALDPSSKQLATIQALKVSTQEALAARIASEAKGAEINDIVQEAARSMARDIVSGTLPASVKSLQMLHMPSEQAAAVPHVEAHPNGREPARAK